ncbi:MAG: glycosyltransferase [Deltaproteobacteria bacterium]|jgi:glycosyltransferase involved in cell wall biosynthesis|nr:glycosyltransferase [Deltaproteobacteria bacterium]
MTLPSAAWVGNPFFMPALAELGWRVQGINPAAGETLDWNGIVSRCGYEPEVLIVGDKSLPPFVLGMERFPCLTVFYAVDTHIHSWFPRYAQAFDLCLVSLKDHMPLFSAGRLSRETVWWSPPYANPADVPLPPDPARPLDEVLFLGTADPAINPERCVFLDALAALTPGLRVAHGGERAGQYAQAKIVLNHAIAGDLNFRVFEALGCGACLVTPRVRHGLEELFANGEDLFTFDQNDIPGLAKLLAALLAAPARRAKAAASGHAKAAAGHYMRHRAESFACEVSRLLLSGRARELVADRLAQAARIHSGWLKLLYLHHADATEPGPLKSAYLRAARAFQG